MNLKIREFKITLSNYINEIDLPEEVKRMVLKEIYAEIEKKANDAILLELNKRESQEKGGEENE